MKKFLCVFVVTMLLLSVSGCATVPDEQDTAVLPPSRVGGSQMQATLVKKYTFESAFSDADVVARVEVGNWLGEDTDNFATYFGAKVLQCFKGSPTETITLSQDGSSAGTLKGYPLFTNGNEMLVFLKEATETTYGSLYWIIGAYTTLLDVSYDESGNRYYIDRCGLLGETVNITNYAYEMPVASEVLAVAAANDTIVSEMQFRYTHIFSEADLIDLIENH